MLHNLIENLLLQVSHLLAHLFPFYIDQVLHFCNFSFRKRLALIFNFFNLIFCGTEPILKPAVLAFDMGKLFRQLLLQHVLIPPYFAHAIF